VHSHDDVARALYDAHVAWNRAAGDEMERALPYAAWEDLPERVRTKMQALAAAVLAARRAQKD
jgi:hypothetical protein